MNRNRDSYSQWVEKHRWRSRVHEFLDFWVRFVLCRAIPALALPPLLAWVWLGRLGVSDDIRVLIVVALSILIAFPGVWLLVRLDRD